MGPLRLRCGVEIDDAELRWRFSRASGPGGQGVNTTDSRVELSWDVARSPALDEALRARALDHLAGRLRDGVITVTAAEHRAQRRNREAALARLTLVLDEALRPPAEPRRATRPSRASWARRVAGERRRRTVKSLRRRPSGSSTD